MANNNTRHNNTAPPTADAMIMTVLLSSAVSNCHTQFIHTTITGGSPEASSRVPVGSTDDGSTDDGSTDDGSDKHPTTGELALPTLTATAIPATNGKGIGFKTRNDNITCPDTTWHVRI